MWSSVYPYKLSLSIYSEFCYGFFSAFNTIFEILYAHTLVHRESFTQCIERLKWILFYMSFVPYFPTHHRFKDELLIFWISSTHFTTDKQKTHKKFIYTKWTLNESNKLAYPIQIYVQILWLQCDFVGWSMHTACIIQEYSDPIKSIFIRIFQYAIVSGQ